MKKVCYTLFMITIFSALTTKVNAQNVVELLRFERAIRTEVNGEAIQKLYKARLRTSDATLICDSAYQYLDKDELRAFGNIQINTAEEIIWTDTLVYYTSDELSLLRGRVIIKQDSTTLFGQKVDYSFFTKTAFFRDGIRLRDSEGTLRAKTGTYFQNQDSAIFRMEVQVQDSSQYAEGDSLFINREKKLYQLYNRVFVTDSNSANLITSDYLEADSTGRRFLRGNGYLRRIKEDSTQTDTTHIFAGSILIMETDSVSTVDAWDSVKVWSPDFSSLSDTLLYDSNTEIFKLLSTPRAWHKNIQLNGDFISVQLDSSEVKKLKAYLNAFAVQEDSVTGRFNQLKGDTLTADFENGAIHRIRLFPNSSILYHTLSDSGEPDGAVESTSPETWLFFENGELTRARMGKNQGLFLPEHEGLPERRLEGFSWNPELKPLRPASTPTPRFEKIEDTSPFPLPERYLEYLKNQMINQ